MSKKITNKLITRGLGPVRDNKPGRASLVVQGYGGIFRHIVEQTKKLIKLGQSGAKRALRELEEVFIAAKLIRVNDEKPKQIVQGHLTVKINFSQQVSVIAESVSKRVRAAWEDVKITINRIR